MNDKFTVPCFLCGEPFTPDPEHVNAWANSGRPFDPTDWDCGLCFISPEDYETHFAETDPNDPATFGAEQLLLETLTANAATDDPFNDPEVQATLQRIRAALASGNPIPISDDGPDAGDLHDLDDNDPYTWPENNPAPRPSQPILPENLDAGGPDAGDFHDLDTDEETATDTLSEAEERAILDQIIAHDALASAVQFAMTGGRSTVIGVTSDHLLTFLNAGDFHDLDTDEETATGTLPPLGLEYQSLIAEIGFQR